MKKSIEEMRELHQRHDKAIDRISRFQMWWAASICAAIWFGIGGLFYLSLPVLIGCVIFLLAAVGCQRGIKHYREQELELHTEIMRSDF